MTLPTVFPSRRRERGGRRRRAVFPGRAPRGPAGVRERPAAVRAAPRREAPHDAAAAETDGPPRRTLLQPAAHGGPRPHAQTLPGDAGRQDLDWDSVD